MAYADIDKAPEGEFMFRANSHLKQRDLSEKARGITINTAHVEYETANRHYR